MKPDTLKASDAKRRRETVLVLEWPKLPLYRSPSPVEVATNRTLQPRCGHGWSPQVRPLLPDQRLAHQWLRRGSSGPTRRFVKVSYIGHGESQSSSRHTSARPRGSSTHLEALVHRLQGFLAQSEASWGSGRSMIDPPQARRTDLRDPCFLFPGPRCSTRPSRGHA
jgi:hypothetical protein